jgi:hypothetical protein
MAENIFCSGSIRRAWHQLLAEASKAFSPSLSQNTIAGPNQARNLKKPVAEDPKISGDMVRVRAQTLCDFLPEKPNRRPTEEG